jgi:hypothetical protein
MSAYEDQANSYVSAGPGAKRRKEQTPKSAKAKRECEYPYRKPLLERRKANELQMSGSYKKAAGVKARIRLLVLDHDITFLDCVETMNAQGYSLSGVAISAVRAEMREIMKLLEDEGLLDADALRKRRHKMRPPD